MVGNMHDIHIETEVTIDPYDVLDEIDTDDLLDYLKDERDIRDISAREDPEVPTIEDLTFFYFHGDLDLKKLFKSIGAQNVEATMKEMV